MRRPLALAAAAALAGCIEAPPSGKSIDAAPGDDTDAARVDDSVSYYLARGGRRSPGGADDLVVIGRRGDGSHVGVVLPAGASGLEGAFQSAGWFELGDERAMDVTFGDGGVLVAGLAGRLTIAAEANAPLVLELQPNVAPRLVDVAPFPGDPRLMVAGPERLWMQEAMATEDSVPLHVVGDTFSDPVFMDVLLQPQGEPEDESDDIPFLGVVDGKDLGLHQIFADVPPQLGLDQAGTAVLPVVPTHALWRHIEGSAQALAFSSGSNELDWFRISFGGADSSAATGEVADLDEILDLLVVQLDVGQNEVVILGRRDGALVVVAYLEAIGFGGLQFANGKREWAAPEGLDEVPLLAAADLEVDAVPGGDEIVLVESTGLVRCLDVTESALVESCGSDLLSAPSTSGRRGW
ncbi:MAG TPA: hypothetical protein VMZ28_28065 [Kofleriaceae bacterium]|nr:hypothetical protein [Kofleriaceae bacterium]